MRKLLPILAVLSLTLATCNTSYSADPAATRLRFNSILTNLDAGGDLLLVLNLEGCVQTLVNHASQFVAALPQDDNDTAMIQKTFTKIPGYLQRNGFYGLQGFGMSVVPRADGLNTVKEFVARDRAAAESPLWRGLVGGQPRVLQCTGFIPADSVLVRTSAGELSQFWKLVRSGVADFATPAGIAAFEAQLSNLATNMGAHPDKLFESLGNEGFCSLQLSTNNTIEIPSAKGSTIKIPSPSFLMVLAVKDDTLLKAIEQPLTRAQLPVVKTECESAKISSINLPMPIPFPFQPSYAVYANFFLLGSTPEVLADAIKAFKGKNGLVATPEYKKAFLGTPAANNGIVYLSPRFTRTMTEFQTSMMASSGDPSATAMSSAMQKLFGAKGEEMSAFVIQNLPDGMLSTGLTSSGGKEIAGTLLLAPVATVGLMAAIAVPSFMKARTTSQGHSCINNMRQIEAAKEQWALAAAKKEGDQPDIPAVLEYIKGAKLPVCPQGGTYKINAIGVNVECSIPGHVLP